MSSRESEQPSRLYIRVCDSRDQRGLRAAGPLGVRAAAASSRPAGIALRRGRLSTPRPLRHGSHLTKRSQQPSRQTRNGVKGSPRGAPRFLAAASVSGWLTCGQSDQRRMGRVGRALPVTTLGLRCSSGGRTPLGRTRLASSLGDETKFGDVSVALTVGKPALLRRGKHLCDADLGLG
jgi:hypothetical protein